MGKGIKEEGIKGESRKRRNKPKTGGKKEGRGKPKTGERRRIKAKKKDIKCRKEGRRKGRNTRQKCFSHVFFILFFMCCFYFFFLLFIKLYLH